MMGELKEATLLLVRLRYGTRLTATEHVLAVADVLPDAVEAWLKEFVSPSPAVGPRDPLNTSLPRPAYVGDGHPDVRRAEDVSGKYEPEEGDEP